MEDCVFCKIVKKEIPAKILGENEHALAFLDIHPTANGHTIVIPKHHFKDLSSTNETFLNGTFNLVKQVSQKLKNSRLDPWGINYLSNEGSVAGQEVFHFHVHVIPKYGAGEGFGFKTNKVNLQPIDEIFKDLF